MMRRWWAVIVAALAALAAIASRRGGRWEARAVETQERAEQAGQQAIRDRARAEAEVILEDLTKTREQPGADRLAGALERARRRRADSDRANGGTG